MRPLIRIYKNTSKIRDMYQIKTVYSDFAESHLIRVNGITAWEELYVRKVNANKSYTYQVSKPLFDRKQLYCPIVLLKQYKTNLRYPSQKFKTRHIKHYDF